MHNENDVGPIRDPLNLEQMRLLICSKVSELILQQC